MLDRHLSGYLISFMSCSTFFNLLKFKRFLSNFLDVRNEVLCPGITFNFLWSCFWGFYYWMLKWFFHLIRLR